ncbi:MAG: ParA family protein [Myxococcales bacterium]|nr:ParA family protein [Myxococcales bacterium]
MATTVSLINMKGGVGKTTLSFNLAWYAAWKKNLRVLAVDLDPQSNLSQYFMGAMGYLNYLKKEGRTVVEVFEQFSPPAAARKAPEPISPEDIVYPLQEWNDGSRLHLVPSRLELAWTLRNPTDKSDLLPRFLAKVKDQYDLIIIDCAPTESILTTSAYISSRYILVPVKPEYLATIGLPLLERSLREHKLRREDQTLDLAGIVFNDADPQRVKREHNIARNDVRENAAKYGWPVFENEARHSDSYPTGARTGKPIFLTKWARYHVANEFNLVGDEFLNKVGLL